MQCTPIMIEHISMISISMMEIRYLPRDSESVLLEPLDELFVDGVESARRKYLQFVYM